MSFTVRVLLGLVAGLALGILIAGTDVAWLRAAPGIVEPVGLLFVARLYDVALGVPELATIVATVVITSFTVPGIPAGAIIVMAPVLQSAGVPVEGIGVLIGVDTIPDMFRTMANVTGWLGGGAILARANRPAPAAGG